MKSKGFTLIELVAVILILGILSAIAAPRFLRFQDKARLAVFKSEAAAIINAFDLVHEKAIIGPIINHKLTVNGQSIFIDPNTMYPNFKHDTQVTLKEKIMAFMSIDLSRYDIYLQDDGFSMFPETFKAKEDRACSIHYNKGIFIITTKGCI